MLLTKHKGMKPSLSPEFEGFDRLSAQKGYPHAPSRAPWEEALHLHIGHAHDGLAVQTLLTA